MRWMILVFLITSKSLFGTNGEIAQAYLQNYTSIAVSEMHRTGIPASIKLAQGLLESDWGRSELANEANNHFGIKCGSNWSGGTFYKEDDDKDEEGKLIASCFRAFDNAFESYIAHSDFLTDPKKEYRYGFLFELESTDYENWAKGLKKSGYATDPKYPQKLISIIEKYNLYQHDQPSVGGSKLIAQTKNKKGSNIQSTSTESLTNTRNNTDTKRKSYDRPAKYVSRLKYDIQSNNSCRVVISQGGETVEQLARSIGISTDDILSYNEFLMNKDQTIDPNLFVYIEKKKRSWRGDSDFHVVSDGENMEQISQKYGIKLRSLYAKNRMPSGSTVAAGTKLSLKRTVSLSDRPAYIKEKSRDEALLFANDDSVQ